MKSSSKTARLARLVCVGLAAGIAAGGGGWAYAANFGDGPPPPPPYRREDGSLDRSKLPDRVPVADQDGNLVGTIAKDDAFANPGPLVDGKPQPAKAIVVRDADNRVVGVLTPGRGFVRSPG